jgi:hypothetical protein
MCFTICIALHIKQVQNKQGIFSGRACTRCGKEEKFIHNFSLGHLRGRENLEDLDLHGNIVLMAGGLLCK